MSRESRSGILLRSALLAGLAAGAAAQLEPLFPAPVFETVGNGNTKLRGADMNLDGRLDVVMEQIVSGFVNVSVALALLGGGFALPASTLIPDTPRDLAVGLLESDPWPDVVVAVFKGQKLAVLRGAGGGALLPPVFYYVGGFLQSVAVGDVNGDGLADLVTGTHGPATLGVNLANGTGGFLATVVQPLPAGVDPFRIELADLDADGHLDVVIASVPSSSAYALLVGHGDGAGGFGTPVAHPLNAQPDNLLVRDLDGDGHLDVAAGCSLIGANGVAAVLHGDGLGGLGPFHPWPTGVPAPDLDAGDFDGDGALDLVAAGGGEQAALLLADGAGGYAPPQLFDTLNAPSAVLATDATADGRLDEVTWSPTKHGLAVLVGDGAGGLLPVKRLPIAQPASVAVVDMDGDDVPDILTANRNQQSVAVILAVGAGGFAPPVFTSVNPGTQSPLDAEAGDLDGDGDADVVAVGYPALVVLLNDGRGGLSPALPVPGSVDGYDARLADLDGDGDLDALEAGVPIQVFPFHGALLRFLGDGAGHLLSPASYATGDGTSQLDVGDLDGDGHPDAVTANVHSGDVSVLLNDGDGGFGTSVSVATAPDCQDVALGDLDLDGALDAVAVHLDDTLAVLHGNVSGALTLSALLPGAEGVEGRSVAIAELDGDGWPDVAESLYDSDSFAVRRNDGAGGLLSPQSHAAGRYATDLLVADIDLDTKPDVIVGNGAWFETAGEVSISHNQLAALTWTDLGSALPGTLGTPTLVGTGALELGTPGDLRLFHARPLSLAALFVAGSSAPAAFKGGVLVPVPPIVTLTLVTDGAGSLTLAWAAWPDSTPGADWYFQYGVKDPAAVHGVALSNAVRGVEP